MANSLVDKLLKNSTIKETALLMESSVYGKKTSIPTPVPMINVALSSEVDGGLTAGLTMIAAPSKHFKSAFALLMSSAVLKAKKGSVILFYDSEFGTPESYFDSLNIPKDRVVHTPIMNIEQLKFDLMQQLENLTRDDNIVIVIDSIGNLASKKEVEDALEGKSVADMTRAKALKSLFRIITPYLTLKDIPMIVVNHTYKEIAMHPRDIVGGGTGSIYSSDNIWIVGRRQEKDGTELNGYNFVINVEKSRYVKEKSQIFISVSFENGINRWSGLADVAQELGYVVPGKKGYYSLANPETGEVEEKSWRWDALATSDEVWERMLKNTAFTGAIKAHYALGTNSLLASEELPEE